MGTHLYPLLWSNSRDSFKKTGLKLKEKIFIVHIINVLKSPPQDNDVVAANWKKHVFNECCYTRKNIKIYFQRCKAIRELLVISDVLTKQKKTWKWKWNNIISPYSSITVITAVMQNRLCTTTQILRTWTFIEHLLVKISPSLQPYSFSKKNVYILDFFQSVLLCKVVWWRFVNREWISGVFDTQN